MRLAVLRMPFIKQRRQQRHAEAGGGGWCDGAVFDGDGFFDELGVERADVGSDGFLQRDGGVGEGDL